jgi:hypothetical protein
MSSATRIDLPAYSTGMSMQLTNKAHATLIQLRRELVPGVVFTIPEIVNGLLENLAAEQVQSLLSPMIVAKSRTLEDKRLQMERRKRVRELLKAMPLKELERLAELRRPAL